MIAAITEMTKIRTKINDFEIITMFFGTRP